VALNLTNRWWKKQQFFSNPYVEHQIYITKWYKKLSILLQHSEDVEMGFVVWTIYRDS
jgi:hypothetical protein